MSSSSLLPPMTISYLNEVPYWEAQAEHSPRSKIAFASRNLREFSDEKTYEKEIGDWTVIVQRGKVKEPRALTALFEEVYSDDDDYGEPVNGNYEYLLFLFQRALGQEAPVFVLSTSKAYKYIRSGCSDQFPRSCSWNFSESFIKILHVATGQLFGSVSDTNIYLQRPLSAAVDQGGSVCRGFTATYRIKGREEAKVKFKEHGILIYRDFSLEEYLRVVKRLTLSEDLENCPSWKIPGIPNGNLTKVSERVLRKLHLKTCSHLAGIETPDYTFELRLSERWFSKAVNFRISYKVDASDVSYLDIPTKSAHPDIEIIKKIISLLVRKVGSNDSISTAIKNMQVSIEYQTINRNWYSFPLIDYIEGWARNIQNNVYFKMGTSWYEIESKYITVVQETFNQVLDAPGCLLSRDNPGHLIYNWYRNVDETTYNRLYQKLNTLSSSPPTWFDGNQKFRSTIELFDILKLTENGDVYIYHVKKSFGIDIRVAASQLLMSARVIYNTRYTHSLHPDTITTKSYCQKVTQIWAERLLNALKENKLHFVLAFQVKGDAHQMMLNSKSLTAKQEVIEAKEEIEKLGFTFHISPISAAGRPRVIKQIAKQSKL